MKQDYSYNPTSLIGDVSTAIATRLEQVTVAEPEDANQIFGRKGADGSTPIVITPNRAKKTNIAALVLGSFMAFVALFVSQIDVPWLQDNIIKPLIFSPLALVSYWPLMLALITIGLYPLFAMKIPSGAFAMVTRHGKYIGVYEPGRHIRAPWYKVAYMVNRQSTPYNAPVKNCPTGDNVMVQVDLLLVFHVEDPEAFIYRLGAEKFGDLLGSSAEEAIRGLVRGVTHDQAYELRGQAAGDMISALNSQFAGFGVIFTSATITNVILPVELASALENQTVFQSKKREQEKNQEYQLKVLNDKEALAREELNKKNERLAADEEARRERQKIMKEADEIEAEKRKRIAEIEAEQEASVVSKRAQGENAAAKEKAEALRIRADAEADAAQKLAGLRSFELEKLRLDALTALASNQRIVISGNNGDNLIAQITAASRAVDINALALNEAVNSEKAD